MTADTAPITESVPQAGGWPAAQPPTATMQAVTFREFGGPEVLHLEQVPTPVPGPGQVLVRVAAVSVGRLLDLVARSGKHPYANFTFPHILGAEHAGVIAGLGPGVDSVELGQRVATFPVVTDPDCEFARAGRDELSPTLKIIGTHLQGAYAQYVVVPAVNVFAVPDGMSPADAVAVALAGVVGMNQLRNAGFAPGDTVIVQGATSALGSTTALLAKHLGGRVAVTSRHPDKRDRLRELGFDTVLDGTAADFAEQVRRTVGAADIVIDNLGDPNVFEHDLEVLAPGGAVVSSGAFLGRQVPLDLQRLYSRNQRVIGVRTGNLPAAGQLWSEVARGFRSVVDRTFPLADAAQAHLYVEGSGNVGRVCLLVP
jgi:NADPH:quinone reductase-like Zn-dependent oxidoreductase